MKYFASYLAVTALLLATAAQGVEPAGAMNSTHDKIVWDTNGDGFISKDEFTQHHEKMWNAMQKNKTGTIDASAMTKQMKKSMDHGDCRDGMSSPMTKPKTDKPSMPDAKMMETPPPKAK
jgi:uncharacterized membrane protein